MHQTTTNFLPTSNYIVTLLSSFIHNYYYYFFFWTNSVPPPSKTFSFASRVVCRRGLLVCGVATGQSEPALKDSIMPQSPLFTIINRAVAFELTEHSVCSRLACRLVITPLTVYFLPLTITTFGLQSSGCLTGVIAGRHCLRHVDGVQSGIRVPRRQLRHERDRRLMRWDWTMGGRAALRPPWVTKPWGDSEDDTDVQILHMPTISSQVWKWEGSGNVIPLTVDMWWLYCLLLGLFHKELVPAAGLQPETKLTLRNEREGNSQKSHS